MSGYYREDGTPTTADDPERLLFDTMYCTFWTDDWHQLKSSGVTCCPHCQCPGIEVTARNYFKGVDNFIKESGKPHYRDFLESIKNGCRGRHVPPGIAWKQYDEKHEREDAKRKPN